MTTLDLGHTAWEGELLADSKQQRSDIAAPRTDKAFLPSVFEIDADEFRVRIEYPGTEPAWLQPTLQALLALRNLPRGWDSYGAKPIDIDCIQEAMRLLVQIMKEDSPVPCVVPTAEGGVQLEWHQGGYDIEVEIASPTQISAFVEDAKSGEELEIDVKREQDRLRELLRKLTT